MIERRMCAGIYFRELNMESNREKGRKKRKRRGINTTNDYEPVSIILSVEEMKIYYMQIFCKDKLKIRGWIFHYANLEGFLL